MLRISPREYYAGRKRPESRRRSHIFEFSMAPIHPPIFDAHPGLIAVLLVGGIIAAVFVPALLIGWIRPDAEDRFQECMALAESAGLLAFGRGVPDLPT